MRPTINGDPPSPVFSQPKPICSAVLPSSVPVPAHALEPAPETSAIDEAAAGVDVTAGGFGIGSDFINYRF